MAKRLKNKIAIVTGGGQTPGETIGNGRATALLFAREGASVLVTDKNLASANETVAMITDEGGKAIAIEMDVANESDCESMAAQCIEHFGRIDILQNNVGIGFRDGSATKLKEEDWDRIFDVNLKSMFLTCKHVLPRMRENQSGAIIYPGDALLVKNLKPFVDMLALPSLF